MTLARSWMNHLAGADKKFVWAKAKIEGDKIIAWNDDIPNPIFVQTLM